ncbi:MAG: hypothetical protein ACK4Z3_01035 [Rhizobium rosettiformans]
MPDSSDNYQLPSWPPTPINRDLWNAVLGSIGERLTAREELEADFEALIAQGTQASLDYIQATVAPQVASLQASIQLAQEQIDQIVEDGIAPNSAKLGGQFPAYYATAASVVALNTAVGLRATTVYVDSELLELAEAVQILLDQKASLTQLGLKADQSVTVSGAGLASGGGNLSANRTITVNKATEAQAQSRSQDDVALTPLTGDKLGAARDARLFHVRDQKAAATAAGSSVVGVQVRTLNTVVSNGIAGASLNANRVSLPAGAYEIKARAPGYRCGSFQVSIRTASGTYLIDGENPYTANSGEFAMLTAEVSGRITLTGTTEIEVVQHCQVANVNSGLGTQNASGRPCVYTELFVWKVD